MNLLLLPGTWLVALHCICSVKTIPVEVSWGGRRGVATVSFPSVDFKCLDGLPSFKGAWFSWLSVVGQVVDDGRPD